MKHGGRLKEAKRRALLRLMRFLIKDCGWSIERAVSVTVRARFFADEAALRELAEAIAEYDRRHGGSLTAEDVLKVIKAR